VVKLSDGRSRLRSEAPSNRATVSTVKRREEAGPRKSAKAIVRSLEREKAQGSIRRRCGLNAHKGPRGIRLRMYPVAELQASSSTKPRFDRAWVCDNGKRGANRRMTPGNLCRGEGSEGKTPQALPARNKAGQVCEGASRREGNQTLRTEGGGQAKPA